MLRYKHLCGPVAAALSSMMDKKDKSWSAPVEDDCGYLNMTRGNLEGILNIEYHIIICITVSHKNLRMWWCSSGPGLV